MKFAIERRDGYLYAAVYNRAQSIRAGLLEFLMRSPTSATYYGWEVCGAPGEREAELLREHERAYGAPPRLNERTG